MAELTDRTLRKKWAGKDEWLSDGGSRGAGRLVAKLAESGVSFYFQYYQVGRRRFMPIGAFDAKGTRGVTLLQARDQAHAWSVLLRKGVSDLHGYQLDLEKERLAKREAALAAEKAKAEAASHASLKKLLDTYVSHLERLGKQSSTDVRLLFDQHLYRTRPEIAKRIAAEVTIDDFVGILGQVIEAGKGRTAAKLRSYLRAAYALAMRAKTDPDVPEVMRTFGISSNPLASVSALSKYNKARNRVLSADELAHFMRRLNGLPEGVKRDVLLLAIHLGGQRPSQLLRARLVDLDLEARTLTLSDPKGAREQARVHMLPLTDTCLKTLRRLAERSKAFSQDLYGRSQPLFSTSGKTLLRIETVSAQVNEIVNVMLAAGEIRERFELRDIRRTAETLLASLKVSSDVRAQLQSHGLGGVQARHYNRHSYMTEKTEALHLWEQYLSGLTVRAAGCERH